MNVLKSLSLVCAMLSTACAYHAPTEPTPPPPVSEAVPFTLSLGAFTEAGRTTITAKVQNISGRPLADIPVTFTTDVGTLSADVVNTSATGAASTTIIISSSASITATAGTVTARTLIASQPVVAAPAPPPSTPQPGQPPVGALSVSLTATDATVGAQTLFSANVKNGPAVSFAWSFGDGATFNGQSQTTAHLYATAGTGVASVRITDALGRTAIGSTTVTIKALPPEPPPAPPPVKTLAATWTCTAAAHPGTSVCNVSVTYGGQVVPAASITQTTWDWGDGTPLETRPNALGQHAYTQAGTYTIVMGVTATTVDGVRTADGTKLIVVL